MVEINLEEKVMNLFSDISTSDGKILWKKLLE
jgi:hypothetical protein